MTARQLRKQPTDAEQLLWRRLRNRQVYGCKFRRQHPIGRYVVDLVCIEHQLVIEIDGGQHVEHKQYDDSRTEYLQSQGYRVVRFWNNEVLTETASVLDVIGRALIDHPSP